MGGTVYLRDGVGARGSTMVVATGQTVLLGRLVERVGAGTNQQITVQQAQAGSQVVVGVAFASQARSIFQSDGATARADNTVYAAEALAVAQYGIFRLQTAGSSGLVGGNPVKAAASGEIALWVSGVDAADLKVGRCVSDAYTLVVDGTSGEYVDVAVSL